MAADVHPLAAATHATFPAVVQCLHQNIGTHSAWTTSGNFRAETHHDKPAPLPRRLAQAPCSQVLVAQTLVSHYLARRVRILVHQVEQALLLPRKIRRIKRTKKHRRMLLGKHLRVPICLAVSLTSYSALASLDSGETADTKSPAISPPSIKVQPAERQRSKSPLGKEKEEGKEGSTS